MNRTPNIFKPGMLDGELSVSTSMPEFVDKSLRINAPRINVDRTVDFTQEESFKLSGILRAQFASHSAQPFEVDALEFAADFPVPEPVLSPVHDDGFSVDEPEPEPELEEVVAEMEAKWQERLESEVEAAGKAAYEEGYATAKAEMEAVLAEERAAFADDIVRMQQIWRDFTQKNEPLLSTLAFDIAQELLDAPLPQDVRAVSSQALAQAMEKFEEQAPLEISLHPDDYSRLQAYGLTEDLERIHTGINWSPTLEMRPGDWIVQSPDAAIRWLKDELMGQLRSRFGLLAIMNKKRGG